MAALTVLGAKTPAESLPITADFTIELNASGDSFVGHSSYAWTFENPRLPSDTTSLTFTNLTVGLTTATVTVNGGNAGTEYIVTVSITTQLGNKYQRSAKLPVKVNVS